VAPRDRHVNDFGRKLSTDPADWHVAWPLYYSKSKMRKRPPRVDWERVL